MTPEDRTWEPDHVIVWSPLQQRWIDHARARVAEVAQWEDRAMAMDHLAHMERHQFALSHSETPDWAACYRQIASIYQSARRSMGRTP
jgi:hypothetical protein